MFFIMYSIYIIKLETFSLNSELTFIIIVIIIETDINKKGSYLKWKGIYIKI